MESIPSDVKNEILKSLSGRDILSLCLVSKRLNTICSSERHRNIWKLKIQQDFGFEPKTEDYFNEYKALYKEYQMMMNYPEISLIYKKLDIRNVEEHQFVEDVLNFRDSLESYILTLSEDENYYHNINKYFSNFCQKYNLNQKQCLELGNIFDLK